MYLLYILFLTAALPLAVPLPTTTTPSNSTTIVNPIEERIDEPIQGKSKRSDDAEDEDKEEEEYKTALERYEDDLEKYEYDVEHYDERVEQYKKDLMVITDDLLFYASMEQFQLARKRRQPPDLDWGSDGCTDAAESPLWFKFHPSCERHDFGYRNYKEQSRFDEVTRKKIDDNFLRDMDAYCDTVSNLVEWLCDIVKAAYYAGAREWGSKKRIRRLDGTVEWLTLDPE